MFRLNKWFLRDLSTRQTSHKFQVKKKQDQLATYFMEHHKEETFSLM
jgi:cell division protein FtsB